MVAQKLRLRIEVIDTQHNLPFWMLSDGQTRAGVQGFVTTTRMFIEPVQNWNGILYFHLIIILNIPFIIQLISTNFNFILISIINNNILTPKYIQKFYFNNNIWDHINFNEWSMKESKRIESQAWKWRTGHQQWSCTGNPKESKECKWQKIQNFRQFQKSLIYINTIFKSASYRLAHPLVICG